MDMLCTIKEMGALLARSIVWLHPLLQTCVALQLQCLVQKIFPKWIKSSLPAKVSFIVLP